MANRSSIRKLSQAHLQELHARIRSSWYGELDDNVAWLRGLGYEVSRSALHRYVQGLEAADAKSGLEVARIANEHARVGLERRLLERLGQLRLEEFELVEKLQTLRRSGTETTLTPA